MWIHVNIPVSGSNYDFPSIDTDSISTIYVESGSEYPAVIAILKNGKTVPIFRVPVLMSGDKKVPVEDVGVLQARRIKAEIVELWHRGCKYVTVEKIDWETAGIVPKENQHEIYKVYGTYTGEKAA